MTEQQIEQLARKELPTYSLLDGSFQNVPIHFTTEDGTEKTFEVTFIWRGTEAPPQWVYEHMKEIGNPLI
ncbi:hypothetical protein BWI97_01990 [Siphonobacter sp. BAB-5405]|uniref:hypothetical protein n=1 Tax=Siphonobacter sp. BAB-5405 TaxID=1864825 RepID=UPI000C80A952|nr:hypothetical protein [Siphonobacter sp. BAB-5405]PMD99202.1 hypothetical protein BWI97_01990 [Siphonobacter sp. BAB-5405]